MTFKMKGFPMHSNKSALKAYKKMDKYSDKDDAVKFGSTEGKSTPNKMKSPIKDLKLGIEDADGLPHNTKSEATAGKVSEDHEKRKH